MVNITVDINGETISPNDRVICIETSIVIAPMCTHPFKRPSLIPKKHRQEVTVNEKDDVDAVNIIMKNARLNNCRYHRDVLLGRNTVQANNQGKEVRMRVLAVKEVSNGHIAFWNDKERAKEESLLHFHPSIKFMKIVRKERHGNRTATPAGA